MPPQDPQQDRPGLPAADPADRRGRGFADRAGLAACRAWLDALALPAAEEAVAADGAAGRVAAVAVAAPFPVPEADRAAADGHAVRAADTEGAGPYNPLPLRLVPSGDKVLPGTACPCASGERLPEGADAVLSFEAGMEAGPGRIEALAAVAPGEGVERRGAQLAAGEAALPAGAAIGPAALGLLAALGIGTLRVRARPRVALVVPGPKPDGPDALGPLLLALVGRDGGVAVKVAVAGPDGAALGAALAGAIAAAASMAEMVLVTGRSGVGADDVAAPALLAAGGALHAHGVALRPGGSAGLGCLGAVPVLLLPGEPLACLAAYDLLASRLVRRGAGLAPGLPYARVAARLGRKIVSAIGFTDLVRVALEGGRALPLGGPESGGLAGACRADGFVLVPEAREGFASGETVRVHLYRTHPDDDAGTEADP